MLRDYGDITSRIEEDPSWYDDHGVPRYEPFHPDMLDVYARFAILVEIECQSCEQRFLVADSRPRHTVLFGEAVTWTLDYLSTGYHYGDPPRHGCVGDSMNCVDLRIVEAWSRDKAFPLSIYWEREAQYEKEIESRWAQ